MLLKVQTHKVNKKKGFVLKKGHQAEKLQG
jgi:hypothetical protein